MCSSCPAGEVSHLIEKRLLCMSCCLSSPVLSVYVAFIEWYCLFFSSQTICISCLPPCSLTLPPHVKSQYASLRPPEKALTKRREREETPCHISTLPPNRREPRQALKPHKPKRKRACHGANQQARPAHPRIEILPRGKLLVPSQRGLLPHPLQQQEIVE